MSSLSKKLSRKNAGAATIIGAAAMLGAALTGCNSTEDSLTSMVPLDRPCTVAIVDINRFGADFGITVANGNFSYSPELAWLDSVIPSDKTAPIAAVLQTIDRSAVVSYYETGHPQTAFATVKVTDPDAFAKALADCGGSEPTVTKGYEVTDFNGIHMIVKDDKAWYTTLSVDSLEALIKRAEHMNLDHATGVRQALDAEGFLRVGIMTDPGSDPDAKLGRWTTSTVRIDGQNMLVENRSMLGDGTPVEDEYFGKISRDFLKYVPGDVNVVIAAGRNNKPATAQEITNYVNNIIPAWILPYGFSMNLRVATESMAPYLASIDGTVAFATRVVPPYGGVVMAHMPQDKINEAIGQLSEVLSNMGLKSTTDEKNGRITFDLKPMRLDNLERLTLANADGYLLITTFDADGVYNNSFASTFDGKDTAADILLPLGSFYGGINYTLQVRSQGEPSTSRTLVSFPGSNQDFAVTIGNILRTICM